MGYGKIASFTGKKFISAVGVDKTNFLIIVKNGGKHDFKNNKKGGRPNILDLVERVIGWLKKFKLIANRYHNKPKKFPKQFDLICAMFNAEIALGKFQKVKENKEAS